VNDTPLLLQTVRVAVEAIWQVADGSSQLSYNVVRLFQDKRNPSFINVSYPVVVLGHVRMGLKEGSLLPTTSPGGVVQIKEASQCLLSLCEREVTITAREGSVSSTLLSPNYGTLFKHDTKTCWQPEEGNATLVGDSLVVGNVTYYMDRSMRAFCPVTGYGDAVRSYLAGKSTTEMLNYANTDAVFVSTMAPNRSSATVGERSTRSLQERLENMATALTNYGFEKTNETVRGRAYAEESYVEVRWWWILLPTLLQLSTLVLFLTTVVYSHLNDVPIWKSSILAIIYHGVEDLDEKKDVAAERLSGMNAVARMDKVQFSQSADGFHHLYGKSHR
jgi:hypothetical protein